MYLVFGTALAVICLAGLCCIVCLLYGQILCAASEQGTLAVVWGVERGEEMEQRVHSLMWLQSCGLLCCRILLVDGGLDEEGRALAAKLVGRYPTLTLCSCQELEQCLQEE